MMVFMFAFDLLLNCVMLVLVSIRYFRVRSEGRKILHYCFLHDSISRVAVFFSLIRLILARSQVSTVYNWLKRYVPWRVKLWLRTRRYPETATPRDLYYCYRLLLGRKPDRNGWQAYMADIRQGAMTRDRLVRTFLQSVEFRLGRFAGERSANPICVDLPEFHIQIHDIESAIGRAIGVDRSYEPEVSVFFRKYLKPGMVFVDVGCNVGWFSLLAATCVGPQGKVYAYDASSRNCELLRQSASMNGFANIEVRTCPLADRVADFAYFERDGNGVLHAIGSGDITEIAGCDLVASSTLDLELAGRHVDVVKIDVEGAEYMVLQGGKRLLAESMPLILAEFGADALRQVSNIEPEQMVNDMLGLGYRIYALAQSGTLSELSSAQSVLALQSKLGLDHINLVFAPHDICIGLAS